MKEAEQAGRHGRELAQELSDPVLTLGADFALCQVLMFMGDFRGAADLLEGDREPLMREARHAYVGTTGTPSVLYLSGLAMAHAILGEFARARAASEEAWTIAEETSRLYDQSYAALARGVTVLMQGQPGVAIKHLRLAMDRCVEGDIQVLYPSVARFLGMALVAAGDPAEAIALLEQAVSRAHLRGLSPFETWCKAALSEALLVAGRLPSARAAAAEALSEARSRGLRGVEVTALRARAHIAIVSGNTNGRAVDDYKAAIALADLLGMVPASTEMRHDLARFTGDRSPPASLP